MRAPDAVHRLERDLRAVFGERLRSLVVYAPASGDESAPTPTLAVVDGLTGDDLRACAAGIGAWHDASRR